MTQLLSRSRVTAENLPHVVGQRRISTLSPARRSKTVFWLFQNVYVELCDTRDISVEPVACSLQGFMERHVSQHVSQSLPRIDKVTVSKAQLQVDEEVTVQVHPKQSLAPQQWRVEIQPNPEELGLTEQSSASSTYRAVRPGKSTVEVWLSDLTFLLMSQAQVQVDIQPKKYAARFQPWGINPSKRRSEMEAGATSALANSEA